MGSYSNEFGKIPKYYVVVIFPYLVDKVSTLREKKCAKISILVDNFLYPSSTLVFVFLTCNDLVFILFDFEISHQIYVYVLCMST